MARPTPGGKTEKRTDVGLRSAPLVLVNTATTALPGRQAYVAWSMPESIDSAPQEEQEQEQEQEQGIELVAQKPT